MIISGSVCNQLLFQIISEGLAEKDSFSVLGPFTSFFSIKYLGEFLHVKDPEVPKRDLGVIKDGLHLAQKEGAGAE